mgnify:CR=1 FL=1
MFGLLKKGIFFKISVAFLVTPIIMIILVIVGISQVNDIKHSLETINEVTSVKQRYAINFRGSVHDRAIALRDVVLFKKKENVDGALKSIKDLDDFYQESAVKMNKIFDTQVVTSEEKQLLEKIKDSERRTMPLITSTIDLKNSNDTQNIHDTLMMKAAPEFTLWLKRINDFINYQEVINQKDTAKAMSIANSFSFVMQMLTGISLILAGALGFYISRSTSVPLNNVTDKLNFSSHEVATLSEDISNSSDSLSKGSLHQAESIGEINHAVEQMIVTVNENMNNSTDTASVANEGREAALNGKEIIQDMIKSISEINDSNNQVLSQVNEGNEEIRKIVDVINEISEKARVINDIVFQTKLLSFNASVEAARAGEHGKGFSVVAEEIGNLAEVSGKTALEISDILESSIDKVDTIVNQSTSKVEVLVKEAKDKVTVANNVSEECSNVLDEIVSKITLVTTASNNISVASRNQKEGFSEIATNISGMSQIIKENAESFEQNTKIIESLNKQSFELREAYDSLSKLIGAS